MQRCATQLSEEINEKNKPQLLFHLRPDGLVVMLSGA